MSAIHAGLSATGGTQVSDSRPPPGAERMTSMAGAVEIRLSPAMQACTLTIDMLDAAPRLFWRCRPLLSAGVSAAGTGAAPNEKVGAMPGSGAAAVPLLAALPKGAVPPAASVNDSGTEAMEGVAAPLPPGSPAAGLAAPNEKLSGAAPPLELGAAAPRPGTGTVAAGAASTPAATASSLLNCLRWCHHAGRHTSRWWQAHGGNICWLSAHEHLLQLTRRQRQSWRRLSCCRKKRLAALTSCQGQWRQAAGCWHRQSRRPRCLAGLRWLEFHRPAHVQWQVLLHVNLTSHTTAVSSGQHGW